MTEQVGQYVGNPTPEGLINFSLGQPAPTLLPLELIARAAGKLASADRLLLQYGTTAGFSDFRNALAGFLSRQHQTQIGAEELMASGAISLTLSLVADVFARRGGVIVCEDPTYFLARGIFDSAGIEVVGVPCDAEGLSVDRLRARIEDGLKVDMVYTIPTFHNPTGAVASAARREALIALAHEHDFVIAADEPYNLLHYASNRPLPLACLDAGRDRVLSVSSFTKILAPGLRLGWVHASKTLLRRLLGHGSLRSGGALNPLVAFIVQQVIDDGSLDAHLSKLRAQLKRRRDALCDALRTHLPDLRFDEPEGGYFVWGTFPEGVSTSELRHAAEQAGASFTPGHRCAIEGDFRTSMRLSFAFYDPAELRQGVSRIAEALAAGPPSARA